MGRFLEVITEYWVYTLLICFLSAYTFLDIAGVDIDKRILGASLFVFGIISFIDKVRNNRERNDEKGRLKNLLDNQDLIKADNKESKELLNKHQQEVSLLTTELTNHSQQFSEWKEKKESSIQLVNELIQNGVISESDAYHNFNSAYLFIIYCYAKALPKPWGFNGKRQGTITRIYPKFFKEKLGCIRIIPTGGIFITNSKRLPKNLQNSYNLKNYCVAKLDNYLKDEWDFFLNELKQQKNKDYDKYKEKDYKEFTSLTLSIFKCSINDKNIGKIREFTFPEDFSDLVNEEVDLKKMGLPEEKKAKVKSFITNSSLELVLMGLELSKVKKITHLEPDLKKKLEIESIFDYLERGQQKIKDFFITNGFSEQEAELYSGKIILKLNDYKNSLKELNISL